MTPAQASATGTAAGTDPALADVALAVTGVQHAFGPTVALRGVDLRVEAGEVVAVTGASGCGKSTLVHVAAGLLPPQTGRVTLLGHALERADEATRAALRRREVGIVLQFGQLVPELTALDNVALPLLLDRRDPVGARALAAEWLQRCGADDVAGSLAATLSGGQSQRVAVARALVTRPRMVFADEPTGALDSLGGRQLLALLLGEARDAGASVVLVTHDNAVAARADREVRMSDGVIVSSASLT
jgi:putative ABC transport system ATP-binding protein